MKAFLKKKAFFWFKNSKFAFENKCQKINMSYRPCGKNYKNEIL